MNAVEIEQAVSELAESPFDAQEFPFAFLRAFGNKDATIKRLRTGGYNKSDIGGVLQTNNIHIKVSPPGAVIETLRALKDSPATGRAKAKFILAADGETFEAEDLVSGETVACAYKDFSDHFGFFLALAGITTVRQIRESAFDIKATGRLNRLYVELLKDNPDWGTAARRPDMNHFMARLIFCFFAEDTDIFSKPDLFTDTVAQMSARHSSDTHQVIGELFRAMNTKIADRAAAGIARWAAQFPYVNGGLFSDSVDVPRFSRIARSYLIHIGNLDWKKINPDIFGSMIQAVAEDEERGALGMHYTSVPNILKVLNPLFLDELRAKLEEARDNGRMLLNLRRRIARIRVFDPACGSGNFLVIAYKQMRAIEAEINRQRGESDRRSDIPLTNFRGIELRDFPAEIARLALIIAEYQCDVLYRGQKEALAEFLPLDAMNWIICGNALRLDWLTICPPEGAGVKLNADDLFHTPMDQSQIDFENEGGETYICGNPPFLGGKKQNEDQKSDMLHVFGRGSQFKNLDYVSAFLMRAAQYLSESDGAAFVTTSSVNQGTHVPTLWPMLFTRGISINFCHRPFKWANNASNNAGVFVSIVGLSRRKNLKKCIYDGEHRLEASHINAYLIAGSEAIIEPASRPLSNLASMITGNAPYDGGHLFFSDAEKEQTASQYPEAASLFKKVSGTSEFNDGKTRWCLWVDDVELQLASSIPEFVRRFNGVLEYRKGGGEVAQTLISRPHQFRYRHIAKDHAILVPQISAEARPYLPIGYLDPDIIITHLAHVLYDGGAVSFSLLSSKLHQVWVHAIAGRLGNGVRYASNLCWNTFPVPNLTEKNKTDLTRCAEDILLAREMYFPASIADLYDPESMPADLRDAHERNDEALERIYIGRRFRNDTERLEKLFDLYTKINLAPVGVKKRKAEASA